MEEQTSVFTICKLTHLVISDKFGEEGRRMVVHCILILSSEETDWFESKKSSKRGGGVVAVGVDFVRCRGVSIAGTDDWNDWGWCFGRTEEQPRGPGHCPKIELEIFAAPPLHLPEMVQLHDGVVGIGSTSVGVASALVTSQRIPYAKKLD